MLKQLDADQKLLALYPRWRAAMAEWDAINDQLEADGCNGYVLRRGLESVGRERERLEAQILAVSGYSPAGAIVKLTALRTMTRNGDTDATKAAMAEGIAVLALAHGIEPYDYRSVT
ncbi:MAG: hypothetical protein AB7F09_06570 [Parvibaculaceae bacterium]